MARKTEIKVEIDTGGSAERLKELKARIAETKEALAKARASNDPAGVKAAQKRLRATQKELKLLNGTLIDASKSTEQLSGDLSKMSRNQLVSHLKKVRREVNAMTRGTQEYNARVREMGRLEKELARLRAQQRAHGPGLLAGMTDRIKALGSSLTAALGPVMLLVAGVSKVIGVISRASRAHAQLQERTRALQSLTGLAGRDIDWLRDKAQQMASTTTAAGVRITKSANEIVDAFTLMGSAKPELLGNREALAQTTEAALTLAEAAKMEAGEAVQALANTMNQFGAGAQESHRYINALAAGAKAGSASVSDISRSIVKFGATASMANLSVEESVGLIEALAAKGIKGEVAGTGLNAVLLRLQTGADRFNPKVVGLHRALENLGAANLSTAEKVKLFGEGNIAVGETLIAMRGQVAHLTEAVTGTDEATAQAMTNTDTLQARFAQAGHKLDNILARIGMTLAPLAESALDFLSDAGDLLGVIWDLFEPLIGGLGKVLAWQMEMLSGLTRTVRGLDEAGTATGRYTQQLLQERDALAAVFDTVRSANAGSAARAQAIEQINREYGAYLPQLLSESSGLEEVAAAQELANQALERNLLAKQRAAEMERIERDRLAARREAIKGMSELITQRMGQNDALYQQRLRDTLALEDTAERMRALQTLGAELGKRDGWFQDAEGDFIALAERMERAETDAVRTREGVEREFSLLGAHLREPVRVRVEAEVSAEPARGSVAKAGAQSVPRATAAPDPQAEKRGYQAAEALLNQWYQAQRTARVQHAARTRRDRKALERDLHALELTYLIKKRADLERFGRSSLAVQEQIARQEMQIAEAKEAERAALEEAAWRWRSDLRAREEAEVQDRAESDAAAWAAAHQARRDEMAQTAEGVRGMAEGLGQMLGEFITDADASMADFGRRAALMALDALHKTVRAAIGAIWAQSLASADSIASFGLSGIARATALTVVVEGAFAAAKAALTPQRFGGTVWARGQEDGQLYRVPYIGSPEGVVYVERPALISERGGEIVVDHARSVAIRTRYPWLLDAIARVPQHAAGTAGGADGGPTPVPAPAGGLRPGWGERGDEAAAMALREVRRAVDALNATLGDGIVATVSYQALRDGLRRGQAAEGAGVSR